MNQTHRVIVGDRAAIVRPSTIVGLWTFSLDGATEDGLFRARDEAERAALAALKEPGCPMWLQVRTFNMTDPRTGESIFGTLREGNAYLTMYGHPVDATQKAVMDLAPGEATMLEFRLSGERGVYRCTRLS
jgi:hypothetical protein